MNVEHEIEDLKRRVGDLEGAVRVLAGNLSNVHPEIASLGSLTADRFDTVDKKIGRISKQLENVNTQVWALRDDFPELLGTALKSALRQTLD